MTSKLDRAGRWPFGFLGMVFLVIAIEAKITRKADQFRTTEMEAWIYPGQSISHAAPAEIVAFGDSLVKYGVLPKVLEKRLGRRAFNLAMPGGRMVGSSALLERLLDAGASPRVLLIDGEAIGLEPRDLARNLSGLLTCSESFEFAWTTRDPSCFGTMLTCEALPSYLARFELRSWLMDTLECKPFTSRSPSTIPLLRRNWNQNAGAEMMRPHQSQSAVDDRPDQLARDRYQPGPVTIDPLNARYAERILTLAETRGIAVIWLIPPMHPEVQVRRERHGRYEHDLPFLRDLMARHPNLTVVDGRRASYAAELFSDMTHLDGEGAIAFTNSLAEIIREHSTRERWVQLRPLANGESARLAAELGNEVEDIDESVSAFKQADTRRDQPVSR